VTIVLISLLETPTSSVMFYSYIHFKERIVRMLNSTVHSLAFEVRLGL